jgi:hypothetical protein
VFSACLLPGSDESQPPQLYAPLRPASKHASGAGTKDAQGSGKISSVRVAYDRDTGKARGFAHVEFETAAGAKKAAASLNGSELDGRTIKVGGREDGWMGDSGMGWLPNVPQ